MKLKNGDEVEVGEERYRVIDDELFEINEGCPPREITIVPCDVPVRLDPNLIEFYRKKGYDVCPNCGGDRNSPALTGCERGYHYGTYLG